MQFMTAIILLSLTLHAGAGTKGFTQNVSLNVRNAPLKDVFNEIRRQTGVSFMWEEQTLRLCKPVTIIAKNSTLQEVLNACVKDQPLSYSIIDNVVLIKFRAEKPEGHSGSAAVQPPDSVIVRGRVLNQSGEPLAGVTVSIKGRNKASVSNDDGTYIIAAQPTDKLIFTYTGFSAREVSIANRTSIDISLQIAATDLNEVVVVGYGTRKKKDLTGAVGVATAKDFGDVSTSNVSQLLQGKLAGVQVLDDDGSPGAGSGIVIRGTGSFTNTSPLYVIDGIQSNIGVFNSISPYDIQDITVLKDAASVAIYGAQGANGVVIVTTRRPKNRKPEVAYDGYVGFSRPWKTFDLMNAEQYVTIVKEWFKNNPDVNLPNYLNTPDALVTRTNWQDVMFRTGKIQEHHLSLGGSSETMNYNISAGYTKQSGQVIGLDFQRLNLRVNLEEKVGKIFKFGQQLNIRYRLRRGQAANLVDGLRMPPYIPVYDSTNLLGGFGIATSAKDANDSRNPLIQPTLRDVKDRGFNSYLQLYGEAQLFSGLKFRSQMGITYDFDQSYNFNPTYAANQLVTQSQISESWFYTLGYIFENYFNYDKTFGIHGLSLTAGMSYNNAGLLRSVNLTGSDFANSDIHQIGAAKTSAIKLASANSTERFISYFGRLNYTLNEKYILSATIRKDATSLFAPDYRVGYFPSVGLAWRLSDEPFMSKQSFISELKLRGSWGKTGNSNIDGYAYQSNVWTGANNTVLYPLGPNETLENGATVAIPFTPNLRWETTYSTDIGFDAGFLKNKLTLSAGYYNRDNRDLLVKVPLPYSTGYGGVSGAGNQQLINAASAYNRGFEVSAGFANRAGDFSYTFSLNASYNFNRVTSLGTQGAVPIHDGSFFDVPNATITDVGSTIGAFYGFVYDHVAIDEKDIGKYDAIARQKTGDPNAVYQNGLAPGDRIYKDVNGDGVVTDADQTVIGNPIPKWSYGGNVGMSWKKFDLMIGLQGLGGVDLINGLNYYMKGFALPFNGKADILKRWQNPGDVTDISRIGQHVPNNLQRVSSWYVENGSYLRVRNVTLGYTFPSDRLKLATHKTFSSVRIYVTAQNLFTFTKYTGFDPEVGGGIFTRGVDVGGYPHSRSFQVGARVVF